MKDIENNEAIKTDNVDENAKKQFLKGAEVAYKQIITYFAKGDKNSLKPLLEKVKLMAERVGFEPTIPLTVYTLSKRAP